MAIYLSFKEVWRNRGRFFLFSLVIALITVLVLFVAALAQGLAFANKEYLSKLDGDLLVFQSEVDFNISTSRVARTKLNNLRRIEGVEAVGPVGFSSASLVFPDREKVNVSLIGVERDKPGQPPVFSGRALETTGSNEAVIDGSLAASNQIRVGDIIQIRSIQGTEEELYAVKVVGITDGQQYLFAPSIFLPLKTWDKIRPQAARSNADAELISNIVVVKLAENADAELVRQRIEAQVSDVEVTNIPMAIKALPGYSAQQSTLNTVQVFTLLIGVLVVGGFFQIQLLQKVPQIGVLKAIGTSNPIVAAAVVLQILIVTTFGVLIGGLITAALTAGIPSNVPIQFSGNSVAFAILLLLGIGPLGGLVSVFRAVSVEPMLALGLSS